MVEEFASHRVVNVKQMGSEFGVKFWHLMRCRFYGRGNTNPLDPYMSGSEDFELRMTIDSKTLV